MDHLTSNWIPNTWSNPFVIPYFPLPSASFSSSPPVSSIENHIYIHTFELFLSFPSHHGFDFSPWYTRGARLSSLGLEIEFSAEQWEKLPSFLQSWLWFGFLGLVLGLNEMEQHRQAGSRTVRRWWEDFVVPLSDSDSGPETISKMVDNEEKRRITTKHLSEYVSATWGKEIFPGSGICVPSSPQEIQDKVTLWGNTSSIVESIKRNILALLKRSADSGTGLVSKDLSRDIKLVLLGVALLQCAFETAVRRVLLGKREWANWPGDQENETRFQVLRELMLEKGWCPRLVEVLQESFDVELQCFLFATGTSRIDIGHEGCSNEGCVRTRVVEGEWKVRHAVEGCECGLIGIDEAELIKVLERREIPVLVLKREEAGKLTLHVNGTTETRPYIAISHVWADGLGNPDANAIPICQAENLYTALTQMHEAEPQWSSQEWDKWTQALQEYGHKVLPPTPNEISPQLNESLPFWLDTLCIPTNESFKDFRELSLNKMRDIYHAAIGTLVLDNDLCTLPPSSPPHLILSRLLISDWRQRLWTYQEGVMSREVFIKGSHSAFRLKPIAGILKGLVEDIGTNSDCTEVLYKIYFRINRLILNDDLRDSNLSNGISAQRLVAAVSDRATSRQGDEAIVLAASLGLDPSSLHPLPPEARMVELMRLLHPYIPANILFSFGPRHVEIPLFSWLPKTLLCPHGVRHHFAFSLARAGSSSDPGLFIQAFPPGRLTEFGLRVSLPSIELGTNPTGEGNYNTSRFYFQWQGTLVDVDVQEKFGSPEEFALLAKKNLILLLSASQPLALMPALLVHWDGEMRGMDDFGDWEPKKMVRPLGLAKLRWLTMGEDEAESLGGSLRSLGYERLRKERLLELGWQRNVQFAWEDWFLI
jgi:hypothetical protein